MPKTCVCGFPKNIVFAINLWIAGRRSMGSPLWALFVSYNTTIIFLESGLMHLWYKMIIREDGSRVPTRLPSSSGENRVLHSHFRGIQSNYDATDNVFNHFWYPSMNSSCNDIKIQEYFFGQNWKKSKGVFFFIILTKKYFFEFSVYYDWYSSRETKNDWKRCWLLHNLMHAPEMWM